MKVQRYKRVQRILTFYRHNFGFTCPYSILLDGTFFCAAKTNKINIREQLTKYLNDNECVIQTTQCVLDELELLGKATYAGLFIARRFDLCPCNHASSEKLTGADCLMRIVVKSTKTRSTSTDSERYFIGTQDRGFTEQLRTLPGVPVLFINYMTVLLEKPAQQTQEVAQANIEEKLSTKDQKQTLKELKRQVLGIEDKDRPIHKKKRRGPSGPNPLSCMKKKKTTKSKKSNPSVGGENLAQKVHKSSDSTQKLQKPSNINAGISVNNAGISANNVENVPRSSKVSMAQKRKRRRLKKAELKKAKLADDGTES